MTIGTFQKRPSESRIYRFDFRDEPEVLAGETIASSTWTMTVLEGVDASPGSMLSGSPINAAAVASQLVVGGVAGVRYRLRVVATTSASRIIETCAVVEVADC
jgi:hypothetical protein